MGQDQPRGRRGRRCALALAALLLMGLLLAGCGGKQAAPQGQPVAVKAMQVIKQDTPVAQEFVGEVEAKEEVQLKAQVSGTITRKMVDGGTGVRQGQPLFVVDRRQYEAAALNTQAQLSEAEAALSRARRDVARYQQLAAQQAISQQVLDNAVAEERQAAARVEAQQALLQKANNDVEDTTIVSPLDGRIDTKDLSVGNYVTAGSTVLATISSTDPVRVRFSVSENDYLRFARMGGGATAPERKLRLILSDGSQYPLEGVVEQVDRGLGTDTGSMTIKAVFANPDRMLVPGMFARVVAVAENRAGALLVPQRAVQEVLGKTFLTVVNAEGQAEMRPVKMGPRIGRNLWLVEEGVGEQDVVVVEGFQKAPPGTPLEVQRITLADLAGAGSK